MANEKFKVLLAAMESPKTFPEYFNKIKYPVLCSPKLDGIRAVSKDAALYSRKGILLPSLQAQDLFGHLAHCDGELIDGDVTDVDVYNRTQSKIMSRDKEGDLSYWLFDYTHPDYVERPYHERLEFLTTFFGAGSTSGNVKVVVHEYISSYEELIAYEETQLAIGFEGIMLRDPVAPYKNGRSTFNQGILLKLKRFEDAEGRVIAFEPTYHNTNEQVRDELGYAKRSQAKAGLVATPKVGKYIVESQWGPLEIAPGLFSHAEREQHWNGQDKLLGQQLKYRYFVHGMKDKPRFPRAVGWRNKIDS